jgi:hypothetical protein
MPRHKPIASAFRPSRLPATCRLYLPLWEGSGPVVRDPRGIAGNFSDNTNLAWSTGFYGPELNFGGTAGVNFGNLTTATSLTLAALVNPALTSSTRVIAAKRTSGGTAAWDFNMATGNLQLKSGTTVEASTLSLSTNSYSAVAVTKVSGAGPTFYRLRDSDGLKVQSIAGTATISNNTHSVWLGCVGNSSDTPTTPWSGRIAAFVWLDRALLEEEVAGLLFDFWNGAFSAVRPITPRWRDALGSSPEASPRARLVGSEEGLLGVHG